MVGRGGESGGEFGGEFGGFKRIRGLWLTPPPWFRGNFCAACKVIRVRCGGNSQSDNPPPHSGAAQLYLRW